MPKTYDRIIIGAGTTAAVYLSFFPPQDNEEVTVIGTREPWMQRGEHRMGQPPHLLMLPRSTSERTEDFPPYSNRTEAASKNSAPTSPFLKSDIYAKQIFTLPDHKSGKIDNVKYRHAKVESVSKYDKNFLVKYKYCDTGQLKYLLAKKVIVATGAGSPNNRTIPDNLNISDNAYFNGDNYLNDQNRFCAEKVAIEGGSATAAWCAEKALAAGAKHIYWFVRPDSKSSLDQRFEGAFPAGYRNDWLRGHPYISRFLATYKDPEVTFGNKKLVFNFDEYKNTPIIVDQFIAAIGAKEAAEYLGDLLNELTPIVDSQGHLHTDKDAVLAYQYENGSIVVLGAGVFKLSGKDNKKYTKSNEYLPSSARPPEGIPTIIATIAALTHYLKKGTSRWVDINLANFSDLDAYVNSFAQILHTHEPNIDINLIVRFITDQIIGNRIMKSGPYGIKIDELIEIYKALDGFAKNKELKSIISSYAIKSSNL